MAAMGNGQIYIKHKNQKNIAGQRKALEANTGEDRKQLFKIKIHEKVN